MSLQPCATPLFPHLLGAPFASLPAPLQVLHDARERKSFAGECDIERGRHLLVPLIATVMSLPRGGKQLPVRITITRAGETETWVRDFAGTPLRSILSAQAGLLQERMGPMAFRFALSVRDGAIVWTLAGVRLLGLLPLPAGWFRGVVARESEESGRYRFDVCAALPLVGLLVHYRGWLEAA